MITIQDLQKKLSSGSSPLDLVEEAIQKLEDSAEFNVSIVKLYDSARKKAQQLAKLKPEERSGLRLYGIPYIAKDNYLIAGTPTSAGSNMLKDFVAPYTATAVQKLEDEGAICIAKANLDAFAHGSSTENSDFGPTKNPHNKNKVPGGSSGGSAAAVALGIVPFALGSDTGGSIRLPASYCGVYGLKPSYGRVSRYGVVAMISSTDCMGPLAASAQDLSLILDIISGSDPKDSTTIESRLDLNRSKLKKVAIIKEFMAEGVDDEVKEQILTAAAKLKQAGIVIEEVSIPEVRHALAAYYIIAPAEISSNLARYDGIRYGHTKLSAQDLAEVYASSRQEGFNAENKRRILIGAYVLSSGYYDAYYKKAQQVRTLLVNAFNKAFAEYDALIGPVAPTAAFDLGKNVDDPLEMYLIDIMTVTPSLIGSPAASVPVGFGKDTKMPIGLQIIASHGSDGAALSLAKIIKA